MLAPTDRTFTEAALEAVRELAEDAVTEDAIMARPPRRESTKVAGRALQEAPDYLKGLLSWRDQVKRGKFTLYLDTSSLEPAGRHPALDRAMVVVALLVAGGMIAVPSQPPPSRTRASGSATPPTSGLVGVLRSAGLVFILVLVFLARIVREFRHRDDRRPTP